MRWFLFFTLLLVGGVAAQPLPNLFAGAGSVCSGYVGPGDIVASATAWYGFRGYSCATSKGTTKAASLRRASDSTTMDINILNGGNFDVATANAFAGVQATATCHATSSTSLICTAASSTPLLNEPITGSGITQPAFIVSCGTFTGSAGTCTMNAAQNFTAETVTFQTAMSVATFYDQTQRKLCGSGGGSTCDVLKGAGSVEPVFLPTCQNGRPCYYNTGAASLMITALSFAPNAAHIATHVAEAQKISGAQLTTFMSENGTSNEIVASTTANVWELQGGGSTSIPSTGTTAAAGVTHAVIGAGGGAATSVLNIDGTEFTGTVTNSTTASNIRIGSAGVLTPIYWMEGGVWDNLLFGATARTNMCHNMAIYWNTTTGTDC